VESFLNDLIMYFKDDNQNMMTIPTKVIEKMIGKNSISNNQKLSMEEMKKVINDLGNCHNSWFDPNGKPTFIIIDNKELLKELG